MGLSLVAALLTGGCPSGEDVSGVVNDVFNVEAADTGGDDAVEPGGRADGGAQEPSVVADQSTSEPSDSPNDSGSNGEPRDVGGPIGPVEPTPRAPRANNSNVATLEGASVAVVLSGQSTSGQPLEFVIASPPASGSLGPIQQIDDLSATVLFHPADRFAGAAQFSFYAVDQGVRSNIGTAFITVHPEVRFTVNPVSGARPLTVRAVAYTLRGDPLPSGTLTWTVGTTTVSGPLQSHSDRKFTLTTGGMHLISLTMSIAGLSSSVSCLYEAVRNEGAQGSSAPVVVAPTISGQVTDPGGNPVSGVPVTADGVATPVSTDAEGQYTLTVPMEWSGTVAPSRPGFTFNPPNRSYASVANDVTNGDFVQQVQAPETVQISGRVITSGGSGLAGVSISTDSATAMTSADGTFSLAVPSGWSGRITPVLDAYTFEPAFRAYQNVTQPQTGQEFVGVPVFNAPPVAQASSAQVDEDGFVTVTLTGVDAENAALRYFVVTLPVRGVLGDPGNNHVITADELPYEVVDGGQRVVYAPTANYHGVDAFQFAVSDGSSTSAPATLSITVAPVNDAPTANAAEITVLFNASGVIVLSGSDIEGDAMTFEIVSNPQHGVLSGALPVLTYTPQTGFTGTDSFSFRAHDGQTYGPAAIVQILVANWVTPLGIPEPPFGVRESAAAPPNPWNGTVVGFYYIDNVHPQSTDSSNTNGYPARPRKTIPSNLPAGSVVELRGGPYTYTVGGVIPMGGSGTAVQPIFIRGLSPTQRTKIRKPVRVTGQYVIIENIDVDAWSTSNDTGIDISNVNHVAVRHSEIRNGPLATTSAIGIGGSSGAPSRQVVIYDNLIHDNGDWQATYDQDHHGIGVGAYSENVWIVDNEMWHNSGDGLQINAGNRSQETTTHHIYVGRNVAYENKQTGMWTKFASDVVFSQNTAYNHRPSDSSPGAGMGWQYGPERVWFIYNHIYDCEYGLCSGSIAGPGGNGSGTNIYIIGNVIHDIRATGGQTSGAWRNGAAISIRDEVSTKHIIGNTIAACDAGITHPRAAPVRIVNNIITGITGEHIFLEMSSAAAASTMSHCLFDSPSRIKWGSSTSYNLPNFRVAFPAQGAGSLQGNPQFVNPAQDDYRLQSGSMAINSGTTNSAYATFTTLYGLDIVRDFDGRARPQGSAWDMGAFEAASNP